MSIVIIVGLKSGLEDSKELLPGIWIIICAGLILLTVLAGILKRKPLKES